MRFCRSRLGFALLLLGICSSSSGFAGEAATRIKADVDWLTADALMGRAAGSPEAELTALTLGARFAALGLAPQGDSGGYLQRFALTRTAADLPHAALRAGELALTHGAGAFVELTSPPRGGDAPIPVIFAGYGISAPGKQYDDLAGLDLTGKAVFVWNSEPKKPDGIALLGEGRMTRFGIAGFKRGLIEQRGAALLIVGTMPGGPSALDSYARERHEREKPHLTLQGSGGAIPIVYLDETSTRALLARAGAEIGALAAESARAEHRSRLLDRLTVSLALPGLRVEQARDQNVLGAIPGGDPKLATEAVLIAAHFDHLGAERDASGALSIFRGADDDASGVAALLEAARDLAGRDKPTPRTLLFAAFGAEEAGTLGSQYFVAHAPAGLKVVAVVDLDMVGRKHLDKESYANVLLASYSARATDLPARMIAAAAVADLDLRKIPALRPVGRSDDGSFWPLQIPALMLFTGMTPDHDTALDTADRLLPAKIAKVAAFTAALAVDLAKADHFSWDDRMTKAPESDPWDRPY